MANRMSSEEIIRTIKEAGRQRKVLWVRAMESDGLIEPRECEPYSFRPKGTEKRFFFHCYRQCPECGGKRNRHILPYRKAK